MEDLTEEDKDTDDAPQEGKRKLDDDNDEEDDTVVSLVSTYEGGVYQQVYTIFILYSQFDLRFM